MIIGVLASGEGTTREAVLDATSAADLDAAVGPVISNDSGSGRAATIRRSGRSMQTSLYEDAPGAVNSDHVAGMEIVDDCVCAPP